MSEVMSGSSNGNISEGEAAADEPSRVVISELPPKTTRNQLIEDALDANGQADDRIRKEKREIGMETHTQCIF